MWQKNSSPVRGAGSRVLGALLFPEKFDFFNAVTVRSEEQIMNMYQVAIRKAFSRSIEGKLHGTDSRGNASRVAFYSGPPLEYSAWEKLSNSRNSNLQHLKNQTNLRPDLQGSVNKERWTRVGVNSVNISRRWRDRYFNYSVYLVWCFIPVPVQYLLGYTAVKLCMFTQTYKPYKPFIRKFVLVDTL